MTFQGIPLHPLVVHFAIVFLLLVAGAQLLAVALPRFRAWIGWALPVTGVVVAITAKLATTTGDDLSDTRDTPLVDTHEDWGERLELLGFALAAATVVYWVVTSPWGRAKLGDRVPSWVATAVGVVAALIAVATLVVTTITGHTGATAVWTG